MKARLMIHDGKAKIDVPAETSRYFDEGLMDYVNQVIAPARVIEYNLPAGSKFGGYPVRKEVSVPPKMQKPLFDKGFRFVKEADLTAYSKEREVIEAEIARRKQVAEAEAAKVAEAEASKTVEETDEAPHGDLVFGEALPEPTETQDPASGTSAPADAPEGKKTRPRKPETLPSTDPGTSGEGGNQ